MSVRGTLLLALILGALVGYLLLTESPERGEDGGDAVALSRSLAQATRVDVTQAGSTVTLVRRDDRWEDAQAADFLQALAGLRVLGVIDDAPADPGLYGFDAGSARVRVLDGTEPALDLEIGAPSPAGTGVYVRRFGERRVLLVGALLRWELEKVRRAHSATAPP